jgi:MFS family permease
MSTRRHGVGAVWLTVFLDLAGFSIIFPLFPAMLHWYLRREGADGLLGGLIDLLRATTPTGSNQELLVAVLFGGLLGSLYSLLQFLAAPFWGRLSDAHGRRPVLLLTIAGSAVGYFLWMFGAGFWVLILARVIGGLMAGNLSVATASMADLTDARGRTKGMALIGVAFGLGFLLGPAMGGLSTLLPHPAEPAGDWGWTPFSWAAGGALLLSLGNLLWVWRRLPETLPAEKRKASAPERRHYLRLRSDKAPVRRVVRVYFLFMLAFTGMEFTLTFLALERLAYEPAQMTLLFVFIGVVMLITQGVLVRRLEPRVGAPALVFSCLLSSFLGMSVLASAQQAAWFYAGLGLLGLGIGLGNPAFSALVSLASGEHEQGTQLGIFRSTGSLARTLGPLAAALLYWSCGSAGAYLTGAAVVVLALLLALVTLDREARRPAIETRGA